MKPILRPSGPSSASRSSRAVRRQVDLAAVEVQEDQPARRLAQVLDPGDRLLAPVAALLQVHRRADPAQLVRDGAVVGLEAEAGPVLLDAQRLVREEPDRRGRPSAAYDSRSARGRNRSRPYGVSRTTTPSGTSAIEPAGRWTTAKSSVRSATSTR